MHTTPTKSRTYAKILTLTYQVNGASSTLTKAAESRNGELYTEVLTDLKRYITQIEKAMRS